MSTAADRADLVDAYVRIDRKYSEHRCVLFHRKVKLECVLTCCCWQVSLDMTWHGTSQVSVEPDTARYEYVSPWHGVLIAWHAACMLAF